MIPILMFAAVATHCQVVEGDRIRGVDLAAAAQVFSSLAPDVVLGFAPQPGARRFFDVSELERIGRLNGLNEITGIGPVCFERAVAPLDRSAVQESMRRALGLPDARIEIVELSKFPVPPGEIAFPRTALNEPASSDITVWSGYVSFDGGRFPIWARVRITVAVKRVVAVVALRPGHPVLAGDVALQEAEEFPRRAPALASLDKAIGRIPRRSIPAGSPVPASALDEPNDVELGQSVLVEVRSGAAMVTIEGKAESSGRRGDVVSVRNPESGKLFRARVEEKGRASVECISMEIAK